MLWFTGKTATSILRLNANSGSTINAPAAQAAKGFARQIVFGILLGLIP